MTTTKKISAKEYQADIERKEAIAALRDIAPRGSKLYTVVKHQSQSGMLRHISVYAVKDGQIRWLDGWIEKLGVFKRAKDRDALVVQGTGMDMGFHVVYETSRVVWDGEEDQPGYVYSQRWL